MSEHTFNILWKFIMGAAYLCVGLSIALLVYAVILVLRKTNERKP